MSGHVTTTRKIWTAVYTASCSCGWSRSAICSAEADRYANEHEDRAARTVPGTAPGGDETDQARPEATP